MGVMIRKRPPIMKNMAMSSVTTRAPAAGLVFYQQETRHHREGPVHHVQEDPGPLRLVEGPHGFHRAREQQEPAAEEHRRDRDHDRDGHGERLDQDQDDAEPKQPSPLQRIWTRSTTAAWLAINRLPS